MPGHVGSIILNVANVYYRKKTLQNEIVFVMLPCVQSSQAFPSGESTATGA